MKSLEFQNKYHSIYMKIQLFVLLPLLGKYEAA